MIQRAVRRIGEACAVPAAWSLARRLTSTDRLAGQAREALSVAVAGALYPLGFFNGGPGGRFHVPAAPSTDPWIEERVTPVLLIHGFLANKSNWFLMERELRNAGFDEIHAMAYGPRGADVVALGEACRRRAWEVMDATGADRIHLIGHSLGGLIARQAVQVAGLPEAASVTTLASPHGGVGLTQLARITRVRNVLADQLSPGSELLREFADSASVSDTRFFAYYASADLIVPPYRATIPEGPLEARNVEVRGEGHLSILLSRSLCAQVAASLVALEPEGVAAWDATAGVAARAVAAPIEALP